MPRTAPDPIIPCLRFFEEQPVELAKQALSLAKEILRRRQAGQTLLPAAPTKRKRRREVDVPLPLSE